MESAGLKNRRSQARNLPIPPRGCGEAWSSRLPVEVQITGSNPVSCAKFDSGVTGLLGVAVSLARRITAGFDSLVIHHRRIGSSKLPVSKTVRSGCKSRFSCQKFAGVTQSGQSASLTKRKPVVQIHPPAPSVAVVLRVQHARLWPSQYGFKSHRSPQLRSAPIL